MYGSLPSTPHFSTYASVPTVLLACPRGPSEIHPPTTPPRKFRQPRLEPPVHRRARLPKMMRQVAPPPRQQQRIPRRPLGPLAPRRNGRLTRQFCSKPSSHTPLVPCRRRVPPVAPTGVAQQPEASATACQRKRHFGRTIRAQLPLAAPRRAIETTGATRSVCRNRRVTHSATRFHHSEIYTDVHTPFLATKLPRQLFRKATRRSTIRSEEAGRERDGGRSDIQKITPRFSRAACPCPLKAFGRPFFIFPISFDCRPCTASGNSPRWFSRPRAMA